MSDHQGGARESEGHDEGATSQHTKQLLQRTVKRELKQTSRSPRIIHLWGWAPHGAPEEKKLNRAAAIALQKQVDTMMTDMHHSNYRWLAPYMRNRSVGMEALHAHNNTAKLLADHVRDAIIKRTSRSATSR